MIEVDEDCVLASLFKRGYTVGQITSVEPLDENGNPIILLTTKPTETKNSVLPGITCPLCGTRMDVRKNFDNGQPYWGCKAFPWCKGKREYLGQDQ